MPIPHRKGIKDGCCSGEETPVFIIKVVAPSVLLLTGSGRLRSHFRRAAGICGAQRLIGAFLGFSRVPRALAAPASFCRRPLGARHSLLFHLLLFFVSARALRMCVSLAAEKSQTQREYSYNGRRYFQIVFTCV